MLEDREIKMMLQDEGVLATIAQQLGLLNDSLANKYYSCNKLYIAKNGQPVIVWTPKKRRRIRAATGYLRRTGIYPAYRGFTGVNRYPVNSLTDYKSMGKIINEIISEGDNITELEEIKSSSLRDYMSHFCSSRLAVLIFIY